MGKKSTGPKAIANRWKAKGLQKLRWYCQMCQKQCRDENGFKCHCTSESHLRQMALFSRNQHSILDTFSETFEKTFISHLSRRFGTRRVAANVVYNEYIQDKEHQHMNSTKWTTLTDFVKHLGKESKCVIDETEKGWYIQWIDRDPRALARQEALLKMKRHERSEEDRHRRHIQKLVEAAKTDDAGPVFTGLKRADDAEKVKVAFKATPSAGAGSGAGSGAAAGSLKRKRAAGANDDAVGAGAGAATSAFAMAAKKRAAATAAAASRGGAGAGGGPGLGSGRRKSAMEQIMEENERQKARAAAEAERLAALAAPEVVPPSKKKARKSYWLAPGIVVKCKNKTAGGGKFYKKKALVRKVKDKYAAVIAMIDDGTKLRIDQDELETVIPRPGGSVLVVNGVHRGETGTVVSIQVEAFAARIKLGSGPRRGDEVSIEYEDVCKMDKEWRASRGL